jgi:multidrug efflux system membrane fusion protein
MNDIQGRGEAPAATTETEANTRRALLRKVALVVAVLLVLALVAWLLTPRGAKAPGGRFAGGGPMPIVSTPARTGEMPITVIGLGAVTPIATVTVQSQISGQIVKVLFQEGQKIKPGDALFQIDPRPYEVALAQAQGRSPATRRCLPTRAPILSATRPCSRRTPSPSRRSPPRSPWWCRTRAR